MTIKVKLLKMILEMVQNPKLKMRLMTKLKLTKISLEMKLEVKLRTKPKKMMKVRI